MDFVVDIKSIRNVAQPCKYQYESTDSHRMFLLDVTDGKGLSFQAVEIERVPALSLSTTKVQLRGARVVNGVALLTPGNCVVLLGEPKVSGTAAALARPPTSSLREGFPQSGSSRGGHRATHRSAPPFLTSQNFLGKASTTGGPRDDVTGTAEPVTSSSSSRMQRLTTPRFTTTPEKDVLPGADEGVTSQVSQASSSSGAKKVGKKEKKEKKKSKKKSKEKANEVDSKVEAVVLTPEGSLRIEIMLESTGEAAWASLSPSLEAYLLEGTSAQNKTDQSSQLNTQVQARVGALRHALVGKWFTLAVRKKKNKSGSFQEELVVENLSPTNEDKR